MKTIFYRQNITQKQRRQYMKKRKLERQQGRLYAATSVISIVSIPTTSHLNELLGVSFMSCTSLKYTRSAQPAIEKQISNRISKANMIQLSFSYVSTSTSYFLTQTYTTRHMVAAATATSAKEVGLKMQARISPQMLAQMMSNPPTSMLCFFIRSNIIGPSCIHERINIILSDVHRQLQLNTSLTKYLYLDGQLVEDQVKWSLLGFAIWVWFIKMIISMNFKSSTISQNGQLTYQMNLECTICLQQFQYYLTPPTVICKQQHLTCKECIIISKKNMYRYKCPECRQPLLKNNQMVIFKPYNSCDYKLEEQQKNYEKIMLNTKMNIIQTTLVLIEQLSHLDDSKFFLFLKFKAIKLMKDSIYDLAAGILKKTIQSNLKAADSQPFIGIGSLSEQCGYCQNQSYSWYEDRYGKDLSQYDLLCICLLKIKPNYEVEYEWYNKLHSQIPLSYKILYGMAMMKHNASGNLHAIDLCHEVIALNPSFSKPYLMLSFIHQQIPIRQNFIKKCIQLDPNDIHTQATHIYLSNNKVNEKIGMLNKLISKQPKFIRAIFLIGNLHNSIKSLKEQIQCYQKCIQMNKDYTEPIIMLANSKFKNGLYGDAQQMFLSLLVRKGISKQEKAVCYHYLIKICFLFKKYDSAIDYHNQAYTLFPNSYRLSIQLINVYVKLNQYEKISMICWKLLQSLDDNPIQYDPYNIQSIRYIIFQIYYYFAIAEFKTKRYRNVVELLKSWEEQPKINDYWINKFNSYRRECLNKQKNRQDSVQWFLACLKNDYKVVDAYYQLDRCSKNLGISVSSILYVVKCNLPTANLQEIQQKMQGKEPSKKQQKEQINLQII